MIQSDAMVYDTSSLSDLLVNHRENPFHIERFWRPRSHPNMEVMMDLTSVFLVVTVSRVSRERSDS